MSTSNVGKDGITGERPGREAQVGAGLDDRGLDDRGRGGGARRRRRGRRGEQLMVPEAEFTSYYGRPVLNRPTWQPLDIAGYFFLGGLAGAGSVLAAGAQATGRPVMARALKISSLTAISASTAALIHDLGRPERFVNMLRVFRPTSPMSVGTWLLSAYAPAAGAAAVLDVGGRLPRIGRAATAGAALLGPAVAAYTAVLAANTAVPAWHDGHRELPFVFTGSATTAAAGMALAASPVAENGPAVSAAVFGAVLETGAVKLMEHRLGMVAEPYRQGRAGRLMRLAEGLTVAGAAGAVLAGRRSRTAAAVSGAALLAASACTRFGVFHAGLASADDPKYTVVPQRERLRKAAADAAGGPPAGAP
ncbi:NrfD/PsrC family molybdoenzyme membrane anchor subunit [Actinacidiphila epipremni]|uniref:Polysulfide reductase NrfD n=1 Tax=Actinacidiphila epipremni TaxID=2053013 RepID=A0ABX0ZV91_9ACTN|nr:NrfD/PsrC family molybdoenzyme membrane anchor subunit [Actinacidiphila epipremni]NJP47944.1 polysulfide reductase NrfD [Actinacidiphila epipremni]